MDSFCTLFFKHYTHYRNCEQYNFVLKSGQSVKYTDSALEKEFLPCFCDAGNRLLSSYRWPLFTKCSCSGDTYIKVIYRSPDCIALYEDLIVRAIGQKISYGATNQ